MSNAPKKRTTPVFGTIIALALVVIYCVMNPGILSGDGRTPISAATDGIVTSAPAAMQATQAAVVETGEYTDKDAVALYLHLYGHLPGNYVTKKQAEAMGWVSSQGNLAEVAPGKSIGGDRFGNYEGLLPDRVQYIECDIDYVSGTRNAKRIIYGSDGSVYYTSDHYESFTCLYEAEK